MTKQEYIKQLKHGLSRYPQDFQNDILDAFEEHFAAGLASGQTEEQVMNNLGTIEEVLTNIKEMEDTPVNLVDLKKQQKKETTKEPKETNPYSDSDQLNKDLNNLGKIIKDTVRSVSSTLKDSFKDYKDSAENEGELIYVEDPETVKNLTISTKNTAVDIRIEEGEQLSYQFQNGKSIFSANSNQLLSGVSDDTLVFEISNPSGSGIGFLNSSLTIYLPKKLNEIKIASCSGDLDMSEVEFDSLVYKATSSDISLDSLKAQSITLQTTSGDYDLEDIQADSISISTRSGDAEINDVSGTLMIDCTSGDIMIDGHVAGDLIIKSTSGDIEAETAASIINIQAVSGDLELESKGTLEEIYIDTKSGDIECSVDDDNYTADIYSLSGDILNHSGHKVQRINKHEVQIGEGTAKIQIKSLSGDIYLA